MSRFLHADWVEICQIHNATGNVHPILSPMSKAASKRKNFVIDLRAFDRVAYQLVYFELMILGCTVHCRFRFSDCTVIHCEIEYLVLPTLF